MSVYHARAGRRQWACALLAAGALLLGGCSLTLGMPGIGAPKRAVAAAPLDDDTLATGSIKPAVQHKAKASGKPVSDDDWTLVTKAVNEALAEGAESPSVRWDSPASGAHGSVTAMGAMTSNGGMPCRAILGSAVTDRREHWFEAQACRVDGGAWSLRDVRHWNKG